MTPDDRRPCPAAGRPPKATAVSAPVLRVGARVVAHVSGILGGLVMVFGSTPAWSLGLGEARTGSHLGEQLRLEIPLQLSAGEEVESSCFRLVSSDTSAADALPWLGAARFSIDTRGERKLLIVTSSQPVRHPAIMVGVQARCGVQFRRDYTLLLDPPAIIAPPAESTALAAPVAAPPPNAETPPSAQTADRWTILEGESIRSISSALYPDSRSAQQRFERALRNANPRFSGTPARRNLPAGTELNIPSAADIARTRITPAAETAATEPAEPKPRSTSTPTQQLKPRAAPAEPEAPRLIVSQSEDGGLRMSTLIESRREFSEEERERLRTELQLIATLDEKISTQLELTEKLRQLEVMQQRLQADAAKLEEEIRAHQAGGNRSPAIATPAPVAQPMTWPMPPASLLGLLATLAALGGGLWWYRRRKAEEAEDFPLASSAIVPDAQEIPDEQVSDDFLEPLSEEDIWPDQPESNAPLSPTTRHVDGAIGPLSQADLGPASILQIDDTHAEEHDSAVELAEIMMSFGRVHGAAQTLADFIRANPKQAVKPWIKLLEVYRAANMRAEFDALCTQLNKTFNVKPVGWEDFEVALGSADSLENMAHICATLCEIWGKRECQAYLHGLLRDNRQGTRQGFPLAVVDEILLLLAILESYLGPYKPDIPASEAPLLPSTNQTVETGPRELAGSNKTTVDFELELADFTKTLTINLDDLDNIGTDGKKR